MPTLGCGALTRSAKPKLYGAEPDSMSLSSGWVYDCSNNVSEPRHEETPPVRMRGGVRLYKLVVLGESGVGKSALTLQFVSNTFPEHHDPTIEESYQRQAVIDNEPAQLDILDTAGQIESTVREQFMRCGDGFLVCYSTTDRNSFAEVASYRELIQRVRSSNTPPMILVGNKCDLGNQRQVEIEEARTLANQFGCRFYETSAALRLQIDEAFYELVCEIRRKERSREQRRAGKLRSDGRSRWRRLRKIFAFIFHRRRSNNSTVQN